MERHAAGYVDVSGALWIGLIAGVICWFSVTEHDERIGLDLTQHRESGYTIID